MKLRPNNRRKVLGAFLVLLALGSLTYTAVVIVSDGVGEALAPILVTISLVFNCVLFFTKKAFPPEA